MFCKLTGIYDGNPLPLDTQAVFFRFLTLIYSKPPLLALQSDDISLTRCLAMVSEVFVGAHDLTQQLTSRFIVLSESIAKETLKEQEEAEANGEVEENSTMSSLKRLSQLTIGSAVSTKVMASRHVDQFRSSSKGKRSGGRRRSSLNRQSSAILSGNANILVDEFLDIVLEEWEADNKRFENIVRMLFKSDNLGDEKILPLDEFQHIIELADSEQTDEEMMKGYRKALMESALQYPELPSGVIVCDVMVQVVAASRREKWLDRLQRADIVLEGSTKQTSLFNTSERFDLLEQSWEMSQVMIKESMRRLRESMTDMGDFQQKRRKFLGMMDERENADEAWALYRSLISMLTTEVQRINRVRRFQVAAGKVVALTRLNLMAKKTAREKKMREGVNE
eukprot:TRINITY_DN10284_c0_g1_i1.p1 TRINITY_DN10284_c0_g1~~TRINITY_DN10284_c0_g1_i1.p1  ORF type:complete len:394 (-),score=147.93 TRINITY_DN10284_c0_g1_i1:22-1203(-)